MDTLVVLLFDADWPPFILTPRPPPPHQLVLCPPTHAHTGPPLLVYHFGMVLAPFGAHGYWSPTFLFFRRRRSEASIPPYKTTILVLVVPLPGAACFTILPAALWGTQHAASHPRVSRDPAGTQLGHLVSAPCGPHGCSTTTVGFPTAECTEFISCTAALVMHTAARTACSFLISPGFGARDADISMPRCGRTMFRYFFCGAAGPVTTPQMPTDEPD